MDVEIRKGYLTVKTQGKRVLIRTKVSGLEKEVEKIISRFEGEERVLAATAVALAMFRARKQEAALHKVKAGLFEDTKRELLLAFARYYIRVSTIFGRGIAFRVATALRSVLSIIP